MDGAARRTIQCSRCTLHLLYRLINESVCMQFLSFFFFDAMHHNAMVDAG